MGVRHTSLTSKQLKLLKLLYTFRFATTELLALTFKLKHSSYIYRRLQRLMNADYIGQSYHRNDKLQGRPAVYYLLPKALPILRKEVGISPAVLRNIRKDSQASDRFMDHNLSIHRAYVALKRRYTDKLWFFTASNLKFPKFQYFPQPLPDAFLSLGFSKSKRGKRKYYFLIYCSSSVPLFVHLRRLKSLIAYRERGTWENTTHSPLSGLLILTDTPKCKLLLIEKMAQLLYQEDQEDNISYFIANLTELDHMPQVDDAVWQSISKPTVVRSL